MTQTTFKQKTSLIIIASIAAILFVEIMLRATGVFIMSIQNYKNRMALYNQDTIRILCIGESTTFMGGENSYPSQLENILNKSDINKQVHAEIKNYARDNNITVIENIPYNNVFNKALIKGKTITELTNNEISEKIRNSWVKIINLLKN